MRGLGAVLGVRCMGCGLAGRLLCGACVGELAPPSLDERIAGIDRALIPCEYKDEARRLVLDLKVRGLRSAAEPLIAAMHAHVLVRGLHGEVVTWVPGRRRDTRRRGFDHADLLARGLARRLGLPARPYLVRRAQTPDQTSLGAADRRRSAAQAFSARLCSGAIVLVDDLVTTGATASACATELRSAGARAVELVAACRTP